MTNTRLEPSVKEQLWNKTFIEKQASLREGMSHERGTFADLVFRMLRSDPTVTHTYLEDLAVMASGQAKASLEQGKFTLGLCYLELAHAATSFGMQKNKMENWLRELVPANAK